VLGISLLSFSKAGHVDQLSDAAHQQAWLGNLFIIGAVMCEAIYAVLGKKLTAVLSPKRISAIINLWGLVAE